MKTQGRCDRGSLRRVAPVESTIIQGETAKPKANYVKNSTTNGGGGYKNREDAVSQTMLRVL